MIQARSTTPTESELFGIGKSLKYYLLHASNIDYCDSIFSLDANKHKGDVFYHLGKGKCSSRRTTYNDTLIFSSYLNSLELSKKYGNKVLLSEIYRALIDHSLYTEIDTQRTKRFLVEYEKSIYDEWEKLNYKYYQKRLQQIIQYSARNNSDFSMNYGDLIDECDAQEYFRLCSEMKRIQAIELEKIGEFEAAVQMNRLSLQDAKNVNPRFYETAMFANGANSANTLAKMGNHKKAIIEYKHALSLKADNSVPRHKAIVFGWLSESYKATNNLDSAYYYEKLRNEYLLLAGAEESQTAEYQISQLYDNNTLREKRERDRIIIYSIGIAASGLAFLAYGIYFFLSQRRKRLQAELKSTKLQSALDATRAKMEGEQSERQEIAAVLHDQVASLLTAADMHLNVAKIKLEPKIIQKSQEIIKDINAQVRDLSHQLVSPSLLKFGLEAAIQTLCEQWETDKRKCVFNSNLNHNRFNQKIEQFIYSCTNELIQNAVKHGEAKEIALNLFLRDEMIELEVSNDINKFHEVYLDKKLGLGLINIEERCIALGGEFTHNREGATYFAKILFPNNSNLK